MTLRKRRPGLVYPVGEDWIYVGSGGSAPAFQNSWANSTGNARLAFRQREVGVVDIHGTVTGGSSTSVIFTLPVGYRPSAGSYPPGISEGGVAAQISIDPAGTVTATFGSGTKIHIAVQMFLDLPEVAS